jgi:hypothetical protein
MPVKFTANTVDKPIHSIENANELDPVYGSEEVQEEADALEDQPEHFVPPKPPQRVAKPRVSPLNWIGAGVTVVGIFLMYW